MLGNSALYVNCNGKNFSQFIIKCSKSKSGRYPLMMSCKFGDFLTTTLNCLFYIGESTRHSWSPIPFCVKSFRNSPLQFDIPLQLCSHILKISWNLSFLGDFLHCPNSCLIIVISYSNFLSNQNSWKNLKLNYFRIDSTFIFFHCLEVGIFGTNLKRKETKKNFEA